MKKAVIHTPIGYLSIAGNEQGVSEMTFTDSASETQETPTELEQAVREMKEYFDGKRKSFGFDLNPEGTPFQRKVWNALLQIPFGKTISYQELANQLGDPLVIRAAASANGKNPVAVAIPCHRVIGADGSLTGYAGGLSRKAWLLEHESATKQMRLF